METALADNGKGAEWATPTPANPRGFHARGNIQAGPRFLQCQSSSRRLRLRPSPGHLLWSPRTCPRFDWRDASRQWTKAATRRRTPNLAGRCLSPPATGEQNLLAQRRGGAEKGQVWEQWLALAHRMETALKGQGSLFAEGIVEQVVEKVCAEASVPPSTQTGEERQKGSDLVSVHTDRVSTERPREAGPVHVAHQMWQRLELDRILARAGFSKRARCLTEVMVMNRLVSPSSEWKMPNWIRRTALADILGTDFSMLTEDSLYLNLDRLHPKRVTIEKGLGERERSLFSLMLPSGCGTKSPSPTGSEPSQQVRSETRETNGVKPTLWGNQ